MGSVSRGRVKPEGPSVFGGIGDPGSQKWELDHAKLLVCVVLILLTGRLLYTCV